jgi:hypothetical protein
MTYPGYSTTQVFYGQQLHFFMTRWQGSDGDHESGKCKEFLGQLFPASIPVRGYSSGHAGVGSDDTRGKTMPPAKARGVQDMVRLLHGGWLQWCNRRRYEPGKRKRVDNFLYLSQRVGLIDLPGHKEIGRDIQLYSGQNMCPWIAPRVLWCAWRGRRGGGGARPSLSHPAWQRHAPGGWPAPGNHDA